jgi:hypothetical protein
VAVIGLLLSSCGGNTYTYEGSQADRAYFRVPSDWARFNKQQILVASGLEDSPGANAGFSFLVGYDAAPQPDVGNLLATSIPEHPTVTAQVRQLSDQARDMLSLSGIRNSVYRVDAAVQGDSADVLEYEELTLEGGVHGLRIVYNISFAGNFGLSQGNAVLTVNQTSLVDPETRKLYLLIVRCRSDCYTQNQTMIDQIVHSYTVRER